VGTDTKVIFLTKLMIQMKKLIFLILVLSGVSNLSAQHYGGLNFTPYVMLNALTDNHIGSVWGVDAENKSYFGYTAGYQGILMPERRFTFSYGLQFSDFYYEYTLNPSKEVFFNDFSVSESVIGVRQDFEAVQIPAWWRYNILKNKERWQPYLALSTTVTIPIKDYYTYYIIEGSPKEVNSELGFGISLDLGVGVNYYLDKWCFSPQLTYSPTYMTRLGLSLVVLRKF